MPWEANHKTGTIKPGLCQMSGVGLGNVRIVIG
jgi:hypothetical protein